MTDRNPNIQEGPLDKVKKARKDISRSWDKLQAGDKRESREQRVQAKWNTCQEVVEEIEDKLSRTEVASSSQKRKEKEILDHPASPFSEELMTNIVSVLDALKNKSKSAYDQGLFMYGKDKSFSASSRRDAGESRLDELGSISKQLKQDYDTWSKIFGIQKDTLSRGLFSRGLSLPIEDAERQFNAVLVGYKQSLEATGQTDEGTLDRARKEFLTTAREIEKEARGKIEMREEYNKLIDRQEGDIQKYLDKIQKMLSSNIASSWNPKGKEKGTLDTPASPVLEDLKTIVDVLRKEAHNRGFSKKTDPSYDFSVWSAGEKRLVELRDISKQLKDDCDTWLQTRDFAISSMIHPYELSQLIGEADDSFKTVLNGYKQFLKSTETTRQTNKETLDHARKAFSTIRQASS